jgi:hypothetical protein
MDVDTPLFLADLVQAGGLLSSTHTHRKCSVQFSSVHRAVPLPPRPRFFVPSYDHRTFLFARLACYRNGFHHRDEPGGCAARAPRHRAEEPGAWKY